MVFFEKRTLPLVLVLLLNSRRNREKEGISIFQVYLDNVHGSIDTFILISILLKFSIGQYSTNLRIVLILPIVVILDRL